MHVSSPEDAPWGKGPAKDRRWQLLLARVFARLGLAAGRCCAAPWGRCAACVPRVRIGVALRGVLGKPKSAACVKAHCSNVDSC